MLVVRLSAGNTIKSFDNVAFEMLVNWLKQTLRSQSLHLATSIPTANIFPFQFAANFYF